MFCFVASADGLNERADSFLRDRLCEALEYEVSRSFVQTLFESGAVLINGSAAPKNMRLREGDCVECELPAASPAAAVPQDIPLDIVYEDADVLVVNKPKGMVVHPAAGNPDGTLVNALLFHCGDLSGINGVMRPGIVHRIDKDTSGLLVVAKNDAAHLSLAKQISEHTVKREYMAVVHGTIDAEGFVEAPIGRSERDRKQFAVTQRNSKFAYTAYTPLRWFEGYTLVSCRLKTGRTHQIRVHMQYIGHPVAGDLVYGLKNTPKQLGGQCLHAASLGFIHPTSGEYMEFSAPPPAYFTNFLRGLSERER